LLELWLVEVVVALEAPELVVPLACEWEPSLTVDIDVLLLSCSDETPLESESEDCAVVVPTSAESTDSKHALREMKNPTCHRPSDLRPMKRENTAGG
jgi:hypothetical protein